MLKGSGHFQKQMLTGNLYRHVEYLSVRIGDRHLWSEGSLNKAADYIQSVFTSSGYVVGNFHSSRYVSFFKKGIRKYSNINARSLIAPEFFGGINLSDNDSFWRHGYKAVMVTDTSFFRNRNYHQEADTIDTLDFDRMGEVVKGLYYSLLEL